MDIKDRVEDIFDIAGEPAANIVSIMFLEGIVGSVAPGIVSAVLAYKQKRSERMIDKFMIETRERQDELEEKLLLRGEEDFKEIKDKYFGLVLDYVIETKQEEKIKYIVNGFMNIADMENLKEDVILIYYDLLDSLNVLDIRVLRTYIDIKYTESYQDIIDDAEISLEQYKLIQNKLERLDLLETRGQSQYDEMFENVKNIGDYLDKLNRGKKAKLKFRKPRSGSTKTYRTTELGRSFLRFFME